MFKSNSQHPHKVASEASTRFVHVRGAHEHNLKNIDLDIPRDALVIFTGVSGSGKSSLGSQVLVGLVAAELGHEVPPDVEEGGELEHAAPTTVEGRIMEGMEGIKRLVPVDQKPIGRTPRSNLATYTGLFDHVRKLFAATRAACARRYDAGRFSFNVAKGCCETCQDEVMPFS
jgi:excinuclease ABC subunit A